MRKSILNKSLLCSTILTGLIAITAPAYAQGVDTVADTVDDAAVSRDTIIVTGSRIARDANLDAPTAITTIGQEALTFSGETNLSSILRQVPSFGVSGITSGNSN